MIYLCHAVKGSSPLKIHGFQREEKEMKLQDALDSAVKIAEMIHEGNRRVSRSTINELPLLAHIPLLLLGSKKVSISQIDPSISEILIYGSVARGEEEVGDIDMMVLDGGYYSSIFQDRLQDGNMTGHRKGTSDWYRLLTDNLHELLTGWMSFEADEQRMAEIADIDVDLHVLPLTLLTHGNVRNEIASKHSDHRFLQNAFSSILRYNRATRKFEEIELGYLEKRYDCDLSTLRV